MLGDGPLRSRCESAGRGSENLFFEAWLPYEQLPQRIGRADIVLGIFGDSAKASRVIPNKVYQALACGRPVVTRDSEAYPSIVRDNPDQHGLFLTPPADPAALADQIRNLLRQPDKFHIWDHRARLLFDQHFSEAAIDTALTELLDALKF
jgi:glycosyltransferase involved in cell wall biosynthesis